MRTIDTPRLQLRELELHEVTAEYVGWLNDPKVNRFLETRFANHDEDTVRNFVKTVRVSDNEFLFGIFMRTNSVHIGNIKVGPINRHHNIADLSLFLGDRESWGKGYATEAIAALSNYAFSVLALRKLAASMYAANKASHRAFVKVGYRHEGLRRDHYTLDGAPCDLIELGLFANPSFE